MNKCRDFVGYPGIIIVSNLELFILPHIAFYRNNMSNYESHSHKMVPPLRC